ncbi:MAG: hypothetical protein ACI8QC_002358 [Planctomycetota bacterium]
MVPLLARLFACLPAESLIVRRSLLSLPFLALLALAGASNRENATRFYKGNTHTHTLWSDGTAAPEHTVDWYAKRDYDFLVLSDHNTLQDTERWFPVSEDGKGRLPDAQLEHLRRQWGADSVQLRERKGEEGREMRLHTLTELREQFGRKGEFLLVQGEEVTAHWRQTEPTKVNYPVHINAINLGGLVKPRGGDSPRDLMNKALAAIQERGKLDGKPVMAHVNHPNFGWGLTWEDLAHMQHDRFFEVHNGHQGVRNRGDEAHPSTEVMWDRANLLRVTSLDLPLLYGVATDDAHDLWGDRPVSRPGRGWIMVRASELSGDALVVAMQRGDFYGSSGVTLNDFSSTDGRYSVDVVARDGVETSVQFYGAREGGEAGELLYETSNNPAVYEYKAGDLFVRAKVVSDRAKDDGAWADETEAAWLQPVKP